MTPPDRGSTAGASAGLDWRRPRVEVGGIQRYVQTLREHRVLVLATVAVTTLAAILYVATATKVYEAEADLLVLPVASDNATLTGLGLISESTDPTRDVETAARFVTSRDVATVVKRQLTLSDSATDLTKKVSAQPLAQSNIVSVTARADKAGLARDLANGFARGVVANRSAKLRAQLQPRIRSLRQRIANGEDATTSQTGTDAQGNGALRDQLATLESLNVGGDPTLRLETAAVAPDSAVSPRPFITIVAALLGGLVLGVGGAFVSQALDPRLRREDQLRELYSLPILARIPKERQAPTSTGGSRRFAIGPRRRHRVALAPSLLSPRTVEAYRTLRTMTSPELGANTGRGSQAILVTGPSPSEGKTTTAVNLASSLALSGKRVVLIESDFRRPTIGEALGVKARVGLARVLYGSVPLEEALVPVAPFGQSLRVLPAERADDWLTELLSLPAAQQLLEEARRIADVVVVDSPPLTEVVDALPLARYVDDVLIVCRLGSSNLAQLGRLGDLLEQNEIRPRGFVLVGVGSSEDESYYMAARRERVGDPAPADADGDESAPSQSRSRRASLTRD